MSAGVRYDLDTTLPPESLASALAGAGVFHILAILVLVQGVVLDSSNWPAKNKESCGPPITCTHVARCRQGDGQGEKA